MICSVLINVFYIVWLLQSVLMFFMRGPGIHTRVRPLATQCISINVDSSQQYQASALKKLSALNDRLTKLTSGCQDTNCSILENTSI